MEDKRKICSFCIWACVCYKENLRMCARTGLDVTSDYTCEYWVDREEKGKQLPKKLTIKGSPGDKVYFITEASRAGTKTSLVVCSDEIKKIDIEKEVVYHFTGGNDVTGDMVFANINEAVETIEKKLTEDNGVRRIDMS